LAILLAVLAFLCPLGIYCFFLASINQRSRPLMVSGRWDAVGLLFAMSGFVLITLPTLIAELYARLLGVIVSLFVFDPWSTLWIAYYLAVLSGGWLMTVWRASTTEIYQVDPALFARILEGTLAALGLAAVRDNNRLILTKATKSDAGENTGITQLPAPSAPPALPAERLGVLQVDVFPAMCHVTLRWGQCSAELRRDIERELEKALVVAAPDENPAAAWFLSVSGLIFGALTMVVVTFVALIVLGRR
jgi:hypothetical protein